jgi:hypothetical protein
VSEAPAPWDALLTIVPSLGKAAAGIAVSFVAYLLGSVSQDLFGQFLPGGLLA